MKTKLQKLAFTLAELLIVILILVIIGSLGYIYYEDYNKDSRNLVRSTDIKIIEKALELHYINTGKYPEPDNYIEVYDKSFNPPILLWKQGEVGENVIIQLNNLSSIPEDPILYKRYSYSISYNGKKYQLGFMGEK